MSRPAASRAELRRLLESGADVEEVLFDALEDAVRAAVMRCAVVRDFDEELYDAVLRPEGGAALADLLAAGHVVPTGSPGRYWVGPFAEVAYLAYWRDEDRPSLVCAPAPESLVVVARGCADWLARDGAAPALLDVLLQCDLPAAAALLEQGFTAADAAHDLAACHDLLDAMERRDRIPLYVGTGLAELHLRCRARLAARTRWAAEYSASAQYFPRPHLERHLDALLRASGPPVLQLFARGGMGKTMQLRWFLGRRCAEGRDQVPCASIDFDREDASRATRNPWLVALRVAEQLEDQLVGDHLRAVLDSYGSRVRLLYAETEDRPTPVPSAPDDLDGRDIVGRIAAVLAERPADQPVVVVVDTCEELLRAGVEPGPLLTMLAELVEQVPALRLVLSGRYDLRRSEWLRAQGVDVAALFPSLDTCRVRSFDEGDRRRYLVETRRLPPGELVEAIVARTGRSPFHLATFADLARLEPDLTPEELSSCEDPGLLYLIERILKRVEDDVRWLLLYAVVPRHLSFAFLRDVMRPFLSEGMSAAGAQGAPPRQGGLPLRATAPPESDEALEDLWARMLGYAGKYSWVWVDEHGDLRFHPDVVDPLRGVARRAPFFRPLHERAIEHFSGLAARDGERWAEWTAEALYHRFQLEGPRAAAHWYDALTRARALGEDEAVYVVAREPLRREYLDEDDRPRPFRRGQPILSWELVVAAHVHLALAAADRADRLAPDLVGGHAAPAASSSWVEVRRHLAVARETAGRHGVPLPQPETTLVESRLALAAGQVGEAAQLIGSGVVDQGGGQLGPVLELTSRVVRQLMGDADAWTGFDESWERTDQDRQPRVSLKVALGRAAAAVDRGQLSTALRWLDRASELDRPEQGARRLTMHADALTASGAPQAAVALLRDRADPATRVSLVRAHLASDRPLESLRTADQVAPAPSRHPDPALASALSRLRSAANADLLRVDDARSDLHLARATARDAHDHNAEALASAQMGLLHLRQIGDLRNAAACIGDALETPAPAGSEGRLAAVTAKAELQMWRGDPGPARRALTEARRTADAPVAGVRLSLAELMVAEPDDPIPLLILAQQLERLEPPAARVMLLGDLANVSPVAAPGDLRDRLRAAVADLPVAGPDRAALTWRRAELERVLGEPGEARRLLVEEVVPAAGENPFLWWRVVEGLHRCGPAGREAPELPDDPFGAYHDDPGLRAAWLVRLVQWRGHLETAAWCRERLDAAESMLQRPTTLPTRWRAHLEESRAAVNDREGSAEDARRDAAGASVTWARLGQPRRRARIAETYELGGSATDADADLQLDVWRDDATGEGARLHARLSSAETEPREVVAEPAAVLPDPPGRQHDDPVAGIRAASRLLAKDWQGWAGGCGRWLGEPSVAAPIQDGRGDLRLVAASTELAALPWELVTLPGAGTRTLPQVLAPRAVYRCVEARQRAEHEVTAAQAALGRLGFFDANVDGLMGRSTRAAVRRFQEFCGLDPTGEPDQPLWHELRSRLHRAARGTALRVLVVAPPAGAGLGDLSARLELGTLYASRGAQVRTVDLGQLHRPSRALSDNAARRPHVVHVLATVDVVGGNVVVDTGGGAQTGRGGGSGLDQLSVTALGDFLATMADASFGPAVVIETPWRPSPAESARSLLLRNVLAHALLGLGRVEALLCTGGAAPADQHRNREVLVDALLAGTDLSQVAGRLRAWPEAGATGIGALEQVISRAGTALFLQRPPWTLLTLGSG